MSRPNNPDEAIDLAIENGNLKNVLRVILKRPEVVAHLESLDKGIGTKTPDAVWLTVRALAA